MDELYDDALQGKEAQRGEEGGSRSASGGLLPERQDQVRNFSRF